MKPASKSRGKSGTHRNTTSASSLSVAIGAAVAHKENRHTNARPHSSRSAITDTIVSNTTTEEPTSPSVLKSAY